MMSGVPLETCWAFSKLWDNKFYYKVASCWLFLLIHTTMHGYMNIKHPRLFSCKRCHNNKAPKFSFMMTIHVALLVHTCSRKFPTRRLKSSQRNEFSACSLYSKHTALKWHTSQHMGVELDTHISSPAQTLLSTPTTWPLSVSITTAAKSVMPCPAKLLLTLFSSVNVWEVVLLTSFQRGSVALKARSVNGLATTCYCHLKINLEYVAVPM
jgi:hypothetical protein